MQTKKKLLLGVIADDFTGAGDAASFLVNSGFRTILYTRIPTTIPVLCDCMVIALKSRSAEPKEAIIQTQEALTFLRKAGVEQLYFKYCSTFDSTPLGNIGVVLDFLLHKLHQNYTLLCPSLPVNGRTVKDGILYVNGMKLDDSAMKNHPLNPMWDSHIAGLMKTQSKYPCFVLAKEDMKEPRLSKLLQSYKEQYQKFYLIPDYVTDADGEAICSAFGNLPLLSGGSGLLAHLFHSEKDVVIATMQQGKQKAIILCGSCSQMSRKQIHTYRQQGGSVYAVDSKALLKGEICAKSIFKDIENQIETVLIYSDAVEKNMNELAASVTFQRESILIEKLMAELSILAREHSYNRIIVAGGETSGAVTLALGYDAYQIAKSIAPGVPVLIPLENRRLNLILKSGNFGKEDFFLKAINEEN